MEEKFESEKTFDAEKTRKSFILEAAKDVGFSDASISKIESGNINQWASVMQEISEAEDKEKIKQFLSKFTESDDFDIAVMPLYVPQECAFPEIEEKFIDSEDSLLRGQLAFRTNNPEIISKIYKKENDPEVLYFIASNHGADPKIIEDLYNRFSEGNDKNSLEILQGVAKNSRTPENIFSKLVEDVINNRYDRKGEDIAEKLADNSSVPEHLIRKIMEHEWSSFSSVGLKARRTLDVKIEKAKREKGI